MDTGDGVTTEGEKMKGWRVLWAVGGGVASLLMAAGAKAADSQEIIFNITILAGTCTVQAEDVAFGTLAGAEAIGKNWVPLGGTQPLRVTLSGCQGSSTSGTPKLTLSAVLAGSGDTLFRDSTSTSRGLGIGVYRVPAPDTTSGQDFFVNGVPVPVGVPGAGWDTLNKVYDYAAGVSCGSACTLADLGAGTLKASVVFTFSYN